MPLPSFLPASPYSEKGSTHSERGGHSSNATVCSVISRGNKRAVLQKGGFGECTLVPVFCTVFFFVFLCSCSGFGVGGPGRPVCVPSFRLL